MTDHDAHALHVGRNLQKDQEGTFDKPRIGKALRCENKLANGAVKDSLLAIKNDDATKSSRKSNGSSMAEGHGYTNRQE